MFATFPAVLYILTGSKMKLFKYDLSMVKCLNI